MNNVNNETDPKPEGKGNMRKRGGMIVTTDSAKLFHGIVSLAIMKAK